MLIKIDIQAIHSVGIFKWFYSKIHIKLILDYKLAMLSWFL